MSNTQSINSRISWLDTLRTIGIFFVVLVHTGRMPDLIIIYVSSFVMPLFFFISGIFVKKYTREQPFVDFVKIKAQRILIPYLTFGIISYLIWIILLAKIKGETLPSDYLLYFLSNTIYGISGYGWLNYNITLWFFPCLFVTEIIFYFLRRLPSRQRLMSALLILSIIGYFYFDFFNIETFRLPFSGDVALTAVVFYGAGYLLSPHLLNNSFKAWYGLPSLILALVTYIIFSKLNGKSAFVIGNFGENYLYFYLAAFSGILFWMQMSRLMKPNILFEEIGKNTLVIFPLHLIAFSFLTAISIYIFKVPKPTMNQSVTIGLFYAIFAILILLPVAWFLSKYTPFLLGKGSLPFLLKKFDE